MYNGTHRVLSKYNQLKVQVHVLCWLEDCLKFSGTPVRMSDLLVTEFLHTIY